jgi:hypothetical protein
MTAMTKGEREDLPRHDANARWAVHSPASIQLLARGCPHCGGPVDRLTQHRATGTAIT